MFYTRGDVKQGTNHGSFRLGSAENRILAAAAAALQFSSRMAHGTTNDDEDDDIVDNIIIDKCTSSTKRKLLSKLNKDNTISASRNTSKTIELFDCDGTSNVDNQLFLKPIDIANSVDAPVVKYTVPLKGGGTDSDSENSSRSIEEQKSNDNIYADTRDDDGIELIESDNQMYSNHHNTMSTYASSAFSRHNLESIMATLVTSFQDPCGSTSSLKDVTGTKADNLISARELDEKLRQLQLQLSTTDNDRMYQSNKSNAKHVTNKQIVASLDDAMYKEFKEKIRGASTKSVIRTNISSGTTKNRRKRPLRFNECVIILQSFDILSDDEKKDAFYNARDFFNFQQKDKAIAREIRTKKNTSHTTSIVACGLSNLLNDYEECISGFVNSSTGASSTSGISSLDDDSILSSTNIQKQKQHEQNGECLRGLENWISKQSKLACKGRRKTIVDVVLKEQRNQKKYGITCSTGTSSRFSTTHSDDASAILRKQALLVSKVSRVLAKKLASNDSTFVFNIIYPELVYAYPQWKLYLKMQNSEICTSSSDKDSGISSGNSVSSSTTKIISSKRSFEKATTSSISFQRSPSSLSATSTSSSSTSKTARRRSLLPSSLSFSSSRGIPTVPIGKYQQHLQQQQQQQQKNNIKKNSISKQDIQQMQHLRRSLSLLSTDLDILLTHPPSIPLRNALSMSSKRKSIGSTAAAASRPTAKTTTTTSSVASDGTHRNNRSSSSSSVSSKSQTSATGASSLSSKPLRKTKSGIRSSTRIYD